MPLQSQFKDRAVEREYLSLLCGHIRDPWGTVEGRVVTAIGRDRKERIRMAACVSPSIHILSLTLPLSLHSVKDVL